MSFTRRRWCSRKKPETRQLKPLLSIPRLGIPRLPPGRKASLTHAYKRRNRVGASAQAREVALFKGATGSCRWGLHCLKSDQQS